MIRPASRPRAASAALLAGLLSAAALPVAADVYKCAGRDGVPIYQDLPCPAGAELRNFQTDPPAITVLPGPELTRDARPASEARPGSREPSPRKPPAAAGQEAGGKSKAVQGNAAERRFLRTGMTEGEVVARVGRPEITSRGGAGYSTRWTYLPCPDDPDTLTIVSFAKGAVANVERKLAR